MLFSPLRFSRRPQKYYACGRDGKVQGTQAQYKRLVGYRYRFDVGGVFESAWLIVGCTREEVV